MPYILKGEPDYNPSYTYVDQDLGYEYPNGLDLRPTSEFHNKLRTEIWYRAIEARREISKRFNHWRDIDKTLTVYVRPDEDIDEIDENHPGTIVFPYTYAELEGILTYLCGSFLFQDPIFQYEGVDNSDTIGAMLLELVIKMHTIRNKVPLNLHTMFRDSLAYGVGPVIPSWEKHYGMRSIKKVSAVDGPGGIQQIRKSEMVHDLLFEGNALHNIDPYMWLPDPSVSSANIQRGEFQGWVDRTENYMNLLTHESEPESDYFNVKYLKNKQDKRSILALDQSDRKIRDGGPNDLHRSMTYIVHPVDVIKMYIKIIPKEWKLSLVETPEIWYFELASDDVIIQCRKAEHNHGKFPVAISSPEFDGYNIAPIGRLEVLYGLQHTLDFLFNSHIKNVRKAINDMLVVDPYLINIEDLRDPTPGKIIRTRRPAWGHGVKDAIQQLQVNDITRANIQDSAYITGWMDRMGGVDSSGSGILRSGGPERLTKAEYQGTQGSSMSRMQRLAQIISWQAMQDIGLFFAMHTQEFQSRETFVKIAGKYEQQLSKIFNEGQANQSDYNIQNGKARVDPFDLAIDYNVLTRDGSIPGAGFSEGFWTKMFSEIVATPELMQQFDITRIFMYMAQQSGAKNVEDFIRVQKMPDQNVMSEVQKGNLVPAQANASGRFSL
jgi:hypothetical protein